MDNKTDDVLEKLRKIILKNDKTIKQGTGGVMGNTNGFIFTQEGVFKYGVTKTKTGYSFHSMAMYDDGDQEWISSIHSSHFPISPAV